MTQTAAAAAAPNPVADDLTEVLGAIQNQRLALLQQIGQVEGQIAGMRTQISRYETLIALLQVGVTEPATLEAVAQQKEMAAKVPLTAPSTGPAANAGGDEAASAQGAGAGTEETQDQHGDNGAAS